MKLLKTNKDFYNEILKLSKSKPSFFYISTYNLRVDPNIEKIFDSLPKNCDSKLIIGINQDVSTKQITFFKTYFKGIKLKLLKDHHLKVIITDKAVIIGGRNLTNSGWNDLSVYLINKNTISQIKREFLSNFAKIGF